MNTRLRKAEILHKDLGMLIVTYRTSPDGEIGDITVDHVFNPIESMLKITRDKTLIWDIENLVRDHHLKVMEYEREQHKETGDTAGNDELSGIHQAKR